MTVAKRNATHRQTHAMEIQTFFVALLTKPSVTRRVTTRIIHSATSVNLRVVSGVSDHLLLSSVFPLSVRTKGFWPAHHSESCLRDVSRDLARVPILYIYTRRTRKQSAIIVFFRRRSARRRNRFFFFFRRRNEYYAVSPVTKKREFTSGNGCSSGQNETTV